MMMMIHRLIYNMPSSIENEHLYACVMDTSILHFSALS